MYLRNSLLASFVWLATVAVPAAATADSSARAVTLRDLATQIYAAADDVSQARNQHSARADVAANLVTLRGTFDAATRANLPGRSGADAVFAKKLQELAPFLASIERASKATQAASMPSLVPAHLPPASRGRFGAVDEHRGGACDHALGLGAGIELEGRLHQGGEVWFRFEAKGPALYRVNTAATPLDTDIAVFAHCPKTTDEVPLSFNDDAFGLTAAASIDLLIAPGPRWVRVRNLGPEGPVAVAVGSAGAISGHVTDLRSGSVLPGASVRAFDTNGYYAGAGFTDDSGAYIFPMQPGTYHVLARSNDHIAQVWPQGVCATDFVDTCNLTQASLIAVAADTQVTGIDFALDPGATIRGRVREKSAGTAVQDANVILFGVSGAQLDYRAVDTTGRYVFKGIAPGTYYATAYSQTHKAQVYENFDCSPQDCDARSGTPIVVSTNTDLREVDFALTRYLYLNASVRSVDGMNGFYAQISVLNASGMLVVGGTADSSAQPNPIGPLDAGTYYVTARANGYFSQVFDHINCPSDCATALAGASSVTISSTASAPTVTFDLQRTPSVSGRITDSVSGLGLAGTTIRIQSASGSGDEAYAVASGDGSYSVSGLGPASYYVVARSNDHHDVAYPNASCLDSYPEIGGCALAQAQAVTTSLGGGDVTHIDMALAKNSSISGAAHFRVPGSVSIPVASAAMNLYDAQGYPILSSFTDNDGHYVFKDIVAGTYFVETTDYRYFSQTYANVDCPLSGQSCNPITGTPISLIGGQDISGVDFDPVANSAIVGRVTDSDTGLGVAGVALDAWNGIDDAYCASASTDANGYYLLGTSQSYYCSQSTRKVSTDAGYMYVDQVFDGMNCPAGPAYLDLCSLANATLITVPTTQPQPIVANFVLHPNDIVFANGFD
ncbi:MAG: carboxypeptidase regulatory-like domain-containing protein [Dokdonella sp.]